MTDSKMLIIVPTRSRPQNVAKVVAAWEETGAFEDGAELCFAYDLDDPKAEEYYSHMRRVPRDSGVKFFSMPSWKPMVHKLNTVAAYLADSAHWFAMGFAGDDHLPRTRGWAGRYINTLAEMGTGIVSCPDGYRPDQLPTQWAMTTDIVRALGRMVPAPVEHLYCDNAVWDLGESAGCYRYLDDVLIKHMHPLSKKSGTQWDDQYRKVNNEEQYARDSAAYKDWSKSGQLLRDTKVVRALMAAHQA